MTMTAPLRDTQLPYRPPKGDPATVSGGGSSSTLESLPTELLVKIFKLVSTAKDLQVLRLVSRRASKAATTALQDLFKYIAIIPTRRSMARFSRLAENPPIAPKIEEVIVFFLPPINVEQILLMNQNLTFLVDHHGMPQKVLDDIVSEYEENCFESEVIEDGVLGPKRMGNVIESDDFERVFAHGLKRFAALSVVQMFPDIGSPPAYEGWSVLNLRWTALFWIAFADTRITVTPPWEITCDAKPSTTCTVALLAGHRLFLLSVHCNTVQPMKPRRVVI